MLIIGLCIYTYYGEFITANAPLIVAALFDTGRAKVFYANSQIIGSIASSTGIIWPSPFDAKLIPLNPKSEEYDKVAGEFLKRLSNRHDMKRVKVEASRIENLGLWQSYAAKRATLLLRAENEGCGDRARGNYEKLMMFHGTHPDVVSKIMQQGFNRMFCGKNAVRFGKGVYFALTSAYSNNYAMADAKGVKRMFICRVLVGETSQGYNEQLVPEVSVSQFVITNKTRTHITFTHQDSGSFNKSNV